MLIVDSQVHIWGDDTPDRPWDRSRPAKPHRPGGFPAEALLAEMAEAGVDRAVLVPPSWEGDRNDVALAAARRWPDRFAVAGRFATEAEDARGSLATWLEPGMLGIRLTLRTEQELRLLTDPAEDWLWAEAEAAGVPVMTYPNERTTEVDAVAARHPDLRLIIDHMGMRRAKDADAAAGIPDLLKMARHENVAVKASCLPFFSTQPYPFPNLHDPIRRVVDAFGPDRVFWGSDMTRLPCTYRQCVTLFTEELPFLSSADKDRIMGRALCDWMNWPA